MIIDKTDIQTRLDETVSKLKHSYTSKGIKASGRWGDSLETYVRTTDSGTVAGIKSFHYIQFPEYGRGPNKVQSPEQAKKLYPVILRWVSEKGISVDNIKTFAFRTALKLVYEGYSVPNRYNPGGVVSDVINERWADKMIETIGGVYMGKVKSDIIRELKKL